jgi:hypothetical protein
MTYLKGAIVSCLLASPALAEGKVSIVALGLTACLEHFPSRSGIVAALTADGWTKGPSPDYSQVFQRGSDGGSGPLVLLDDMEPTRACGVTSSSLTAQAGAELAKSFEARLTDAKAVKRDQIEGWEGQLNGHHVVLYVVTGATRPPFQGIAVMVEGQP